MSKFVNLNIKLGAFSTLTAVLLATVFMNSVLPILEDKTDTSVVVNSH